MVEFLNESIKKDGVIVTVLAIEMDTSLVVHKCHTENGFVSYGSFKEKRFESKRIELNVQQHTLQVNRHRQRCAT